MEPNFKSWHDDAKERGIFGVTGWTVHDVTYAAQVLDIELTEEEAFEWLQDNAKYIVDAMVRVGNETLSDLLFEEFKEV